LPATTSPPNGSFGDNKILTPAPQPDPPVKTPLLLFTGAATLFGLILYAGDVLFNHRPPLSPTGAWWLPVMCAVSVLVTTWLLWPWKPGAVSGLAIGFVAHPVLWFLFMTAQWIAAGGTDDYKEVLVQCGVVSAFSLILAGWFTVTAGALLGYWHARPRKQN
jgi:hypothetical protein